MRDAWRMTTRSRLLAMAALTFAAACASNDPQAGDTTAAGDSTGSPEDTMPPAAARPPAPHGRECAMRPVTGEGLGDVTIGMTEAEVRARCTVTLDTMITGAEGMPQRILSVAMGGETMDLEMKEGRVWRIPITDARFRTADGFGVGTPLAELLALPGAKPAMGEGTFIMTTKHCGLSFRLRNPRGTMPAARNDAEMRRLPGSAVVERMLIVGCQ